MMILETDEGEWYNENRSTDVWSGILSGIYAI